MKVLFHLPCPVIGGAETQLKYLVKRLSPGVAVTVTHEHAEVEPLFDDMPGVSTRRVRSVAELARTVSAVRPDVVQFFHSATMYAALRRLAGGGPRPRVCEIAHNRVMFSGDLTSYGKDRTDVVVCVSHDVQRYVQASLPRAHTVVIPNGVDSATFVPGGKRAPRPRPLGGFTGRLTDGDEKGIWRLVRIVADLPVDFELVGVDQGRYVERIRAEGITNVSVVPFTSNPAACYQRWDFFASRSPAEGFGMSIAEAMACGLPSVIFRCGGVCSYLEHGKHALIADDDQQMSAFIRQVAAGDASLHPRDVHFGADRMAGAYEALYAGLTIHRVATPTRTAWSAAAGRARTG